MPSMLTHPNADAPWPPLATQEPFASWLALIASLRHALLCVLVGFLSATCAYAQVVQGQPQMQLPRLQISAGMHLIDAQVAANFEQRATGLMHRKDMPVNEGMLFVFEQPAQQCFWMKNTLLPLTAAFVADDGRIVNLVDMKPQTLDSHCSTEPVRFVLEMNQGWFAKKGLKAGHMLRSSLFKN